MRSRGISVSIIIQNLAQLKKLYPKEWESITGNCDEFLFLGGNEQSTFEYVSKLLGKETVDMNTYNSSSGKNGHYTKNSSLNGRELMTPDEIRVLDNSEALLFIRGERAVKDKKYNLLRHPNIHLTPDGGGKKFVYGIDTLSYATITEEDLDWAKEQGIRNLPKVKVLTAKEYYDQEDQDEDVKEKPQHRPAKKAEAKNASAS